MIEMLLKMSLTGTIVICMVLLLRLCLRCAPKIFSYVLWLIVLFRLLCPVSVALPVSVFNSAKMIFPPGRATSRSGTPAFPGLTNLNAFPPSLFTPSRRRPSISDSFTQQSPFFAVTTTSHARYIPVRIRRIREYLEALNVYLSLLRF